MVADAWISPAAITLQLPVAVATLRDKKAASIPIVTRERVTDSKYVIPPLSSYAFAERVSLRLQILYSETTCRRISFTGTQILGHGMASVYRKKAPHESPT